RAVLVTAWCSGTERRGGRPNGVHLDPSGRTSAAGAKGWTLEWCSPLPARPTIKAERRGGIPVRIHPSAAHTRSGAAGWTSTSDVRPAFRPFGYTRTEAAGWTSTPDVQPALLPLAPEDRFGVCEQHTLPLALRPQPLDLVAQDLDVLQRLQGGDQTFLLRAVLARGREQEQFFVGIDVEVHLPAGPTARPAAALRFLPGRRLRWAAGEE